MIGAPAHHILNDNPIWDLPFNVIICTPALNMVNNTRIGASIQGVWSPTWPIQNDPGETKDLADEHPEKVEEMQVQLRKW